MFLVNDHPSDCVVAARSSDEVSKENSEKKRSLFHENAKDLHKYSIYNI